MTLIERDNDGIAHIVALSGGKDSTAMALRLAEVEPDTPFNYVCTPTGDELPEMFAHWRKLGDLLGKQILPVMEGTLDSCMSDNNCIPNHRMRFCTRLLKIAPFKKMLVAAMPAVSYVGLRADELDREGANYGGDTSLQIDGEMGVQQKYPFREWGWNLAEVMEYLDKRGVSVPQRTDCARCFFQTISEWYSLWRDHPDLFEKGVQDELKYGYTYRSIKKDPDTKEPVTRSRSLPLFGEDFKHTVSWRDSWPARLDEMRTMFEMGYKPKDNPHRPQMCRTCTL